MGVGLVHSRGRRWKHLPSERQRLMMTPVKDVKYDTDDILEIEGVLWKIVKVFNFDHEGHECDVVTLMNFNGDERELYTYDEGTTFLED